MALRDDLATSSSYFMVEIKSLKRIIDAGKEKKHPVMCFVDEVLRGTNTVERIAASTEILKSLAEDHIFSFAATHDVELTKLLEDAYENYHFEERIENNAVSYTHLDVYKRQPTTEHVGIMWYTETKPDSVHLHIYRKPKAM